MLGLILTGIVASAAVIVATRPKAEPERKAVPVRMKSKTGRR